MGVRQLRLTQFRNLQDQTLEFESDRILISGDNGSGKTSFLEALSVLHHHRSFRTHELKQAIQHGKDSFTLFGVINECSIGIQRNRQSSRLRINQEDVSHVSALARIRPVQSITPERFHLLHGSPAQRRSYVDWMVFHVEPSFHQHWQSYRKTLQQRNVLLKQSAPLDQIRRWDKHLHEQGEALNHLRVNVVRKLEEILPYWLDQFKSLGMNEIECRWQKGWKSELSLAIALSESLQTDYKQGFTTVGPQRADLKLFLGKHPVQQVLSRGQLKRLIIALIHLQLKIVHEVSQVGMTLLLDDLNSELDEEGQRLILDSLDQPDLQVFISNISQHSPKQWQNSELQRFHVEHGMIHPH